MYIACQEVRKRLFKISNWALELIFSFLLTSVACVSPGQPCTKHTHKEIFVSWKSSVNKALILFWCKVHCCTREQTDEETCRGLYLWGFKFSFYSRIIKLALRLQKPWAGMDTFFFFIISTFQDWVTYRNFKSWRVFKEYLSCRPTSNKIAITSQRGDMLSTTKCISLWEAG